jgi:peroxiredoxin
LADYEAHLEELRALDTAVIAVSVDDGARSTRVRRQVGVSFPLLCDPSRRTIDAWRMYDAHDWRDVAVPGVILVARDLTIEHVSTGDSRHRLMAAEALAFLRQTTGAPAAHELSAGLRNWMRIVGNVARGGFKMPRRAD